MIEYEVKELKDLIESEGNEKRFEYKGYECAIKRVPELLHLCGYIKIPEEHVLHGRDGEDYGLIELPAHGGVTYSGSLEEDGDFWIGFDCAHAGDLVPMLKFYPIEHGRLFNNPLIPELMSGETYKDMKYVENNIVEIIDAIEDELTKKLED